jgi:hypothetical protein
VTCNLTINLVKTEDPIKDLFSFDNWLDYNGISKHSNEWFRYFADAVSRSKDSHLVLEEITKIKNLSYIEAHRYLLTQSVFKTRDENGWVSFMQNLKPTHTSNTFQTFIPEFEMYARMLSPICTFLSDTFLIRELFSKFSSSIQGIIKNHFLYKDFDSLDEFIKFLKRTFDHQWTSLKLNPTIFKGNDQKNNDLPSKDFKKNDFKNSKKTSFDSKRKRDHRNHETLGEEEKKSKLAKREMNEEAKKHEVFCRFCQEPHDHRTCQKLKTHQEEKKKGKFAKMEAKSPGKKYQGRKKINLFLNTIAFLLGQNSFVVSFATTHQYLLP